MKDLLKAANTLDRGGFTKVGRALQKHLDRAGSAFPKISGNPASVNAQGETILKSILENPAITVIQNMTRSVAQVIDYKIPGGIGARFSSDGKTFIGFLEP